MSREEQWESNTEKFLQAAYPERSRSQSSLQRASSPLTLKRSHSDGELARAHHSLGMLKLDEVRQVEIKKEDHTFRTIIIVVGLILFVILSVDVRNSIHREMHRLQIQAKHCHQAYTENECHDPVDALREACKQYQLCYSTSANQKIKISQVLSNLLGEAASSLTKSAGITGSIFLLCLAAVVLFFVYKSSKAVMVVKKK